MLRNVDWYLVTDVSGQPNGPIFKGQAVYYSSCIAWPFKMGPIGSPETSVANYQSTLRNISEERKHLHRSGKLKVTQYYTPEEHKLKRHDHEDGGNKCIRIVCILLEDCAISQSKM